ncbi:hypothetical protein WCX18_00725 [Sulfurimonas sp. HSL1-2]|uniref:hypothetical protein n=1 Tax=Thiomicrolovo zhangzhouensis TaxID=3131933 RepID=UPI0031F936BA
MAATAILFAVMDIAIYLVFLALLNSLIPERVPNIKRYMVWSIFAVIFLPVSFIVGGVFFIPFPLFIVFTFIYILVSLYLYWKERTIDTRVKKMILMDQKLTMKDVVDTLNVSESRINEAVLRLKSRALVPVSTSL